MKGLLTKDFALLFQRKRVFVFLAFWAVLMCVTMEDSSFMIGWLTVIMSFFAISSVTYDEYDNCYPFLMTLPINGKTYAIEKYLFGFFCGFSAWLFAVIVSLIFAVSKGTPGLFLSDLSQMLVFIPVFMFLINVSLPLNLKFGSERGRIYMLIIWGIPFVLVIFAEKLFHNGTAFLDAILDARLLIPVSFALTIVLTVISVIISIRVMEKKEY